MEMPDEPIPWMTDEIRELLKQIHGPHARKKRATAIKLAFARANEQPLAEIFRQEDVCSETIWYQKWRLQEAIRAAYEACYQRALEWADDETARLEALYRRKRRRTIAEYAAEAPGALAVVMSDGEQRGSDRISAADTLMRWAEPEVASKLQPAAGGAGGDQVVNQFLSGLSNDQLERLVGLTDADGEGADEAAGDAPAAGAG